MSAVSSLFHIVLNTKGRKLVIPEFAEKLLYQYISGIIRNHQSQVIAINGIGNHIHILVELSPTLSLSDLVRDIKQGSSKWIKTQASFPFFESWGKEYGAFSCSARNRQAIINYITNQKEHHQSKSFEEEYLAMIEASGLDWNEYRLT